MKQLARIIPNLEVVDGKPCIRSLQVSVATIVGLMAAAHAPAETLNVYPYLEEVDLYEALAYAAWHTEEIEVPLEST
ncbi:MAG TPA: DUF433 domain-containing protein [Crinalium sp.]